MLPACTGFRAWAGRDRGRTPEPVFASRGAHSEIRHEHGGYTLHADLLHAGAPDAAVARENGASLILAGELYNRAELHSLLPPEAAAPETDAELVLALFGRYDLHAFRLLNGRFAVLLKAGERVLLATDHAGSVPLYLATDAGWVAVATEAKTLRTAPPGRRLAAARPVERLTGVHQVPAGTVLEIPLSGGACTGHRTWAPALSRRILPEDAAVDAVRRALERAVDARLGPQPPLVVLSGGIDSSTVAALAAARAPRRIDTVSMGTDEADEFAHARLVADHLGSAHEEITIPTADLLGRLPHTVWAAESLDPDIIEYLLPLVALYSRVEGTGRRILTGYGADIPLGGMHREERLPALDTALARDMETYDGLNEMSPVLSGIAGHWSTHPYWDRDVLDVLVPLEAGLKRRYRMDKWVLRAAMGDLLPRPTVLRPKLGVHEGSGTTSSFSRLLTAAGVPQARVHHAKVLVVHELFDQTVVSGRHPDEVSLEQVVHRVCDLVRRGADAGAGPARPGR